MRKGLFILVVTTIAFVSSAFSLRADAIGQLPDGSWVEQYAVTFAPGETFPWHFHTGPLAIVVVEGELTEYHGCGEAPTVHSAGQAFTEEIGAVHMVTNNGSAPVTLVISGILPSFYGDFNDTILVDGPRCDGSSGRSKREPVPPCP